MKKFVILAVLSAVLFSVAGSVNSHVLGKGQKVFLSQNAIPNSYIVVFDETTIGQDLAAPGVEADAQYLAAADGSYRLSWPSSSVGRPSNHGSSNAKNWTLVSDWLPSDLRHDELYISTARTLVITHIFFMFVAKFLILGTSTSNVASRARWFASRVARLLCAPESRPTAPRRPARCDASSRRVALPTRRPGSPGLAVRRRPLPPLRRGAPAPAIARSTTARPQSPAPPSTFRSDTPLPSGCLPRRLRS